MATTGAKTYRNYIGGEWVDATSGEPVVVDGPFVEAPEYVGGFWVIEAADQDAAVRWATQASKALGGRIEVRAFQDPQDA